MKRRAELLVEKRDGQLQWLRATKLARSILKALTHEGEVEEWRALDLAGTVLAGLRAKRAKRSRKNVKTQDLAELVQKVLFATGYPGAAEAYVLVGLEQQRRGRVITATALSEAPASDDSVRERAAVPPPAISDRLRNN